MASGASPRLISVFSASSGSVGAEGEGGAESDGAGAGALGISVGRSVGAAVTALPLTAPRSSAPSSPHPARSNGTTGHNRSDEHTSELQSLMRISYAVFCLKKKTVNNPSTKYN